MPLIELDPDSYAESFPDNLRDGLEGHGWRIHAAEGSNPDSDPYEHAKRGRCMFCGGRLTEMSIMLVGAEGIFGLFCNGNCTLMMHAATFLDDLHSQIAQQANHAAGS